MQTLARFISFTGEGALRVVARDSRLLVAWSQNELRRSGSTTVPAARSVTGLAGPEVSWREIGKVPLPTSA